MGGQEYTPDTETVRAASARAIGTDWFDRWLGAHDREVRAEGHRQGCETARQDMISGAFIGGPTFEALRASFTGQRIARDIVELAAQEADRGYLASESCDDIAARIRALKP
ncbi:MAG: hypothetical protein ABFE16_00815 [Armatimonadia bacterium]